MGTSVAAGHEWQAELRARGYRLTPQRQLVLEAVGQLGHCTPEEILAAVRQTASGVNVSTVYRTLELLEELGLVRHTHLSHGAPTYSLAGSDNHVHLVCRDCETVIEIDAGMLKGLAGNLRSKHGFTLDVGHVALFGRCQACAGNAQVTLSE